MFRLPPAVRVKTRKARLGSNSMCCNTLSHSLSPAYYPGMTKASVNETLFLFLFRYRGSVRKLVRHEKDSCQATLSLRNDAQQCEGPTGHQHQRTEQAAWNSYEHARRLHTGDTLPSKP